MDPVQPRRSHDVCVFRVEFKYGEFAIDSASCGRYDGSGCPRGPLRVRFTNPVAGEQVVRDEDALRSGRRPAALQAQAKAAAAGRVASLEELVGVVAVNG